MAVRASSCDFLQNVKLGDWHPRQILKTAEAIEQQRMTGDNVCQWSQACIYADEIVPLRQGPYGLEQTYHLGTSISTEMLKNAYTGYCRQHGQRAANEEVFGKACAEMFGPRKRLKAARTKVPMRAGRGVMTCLMVTSGRKNSMRGLGSRSKNRHTWPTIVAGRVSHLSHLPAAGETAKTCMDWAFVSPVSPVSPILKIIGRTKNLICRMRNWNGKRGMEAINRHQASFAETGETSATNMRF